MNIENYDEDEECYDDDDEVTKLDVQEMCDEENDVYEADACDSPFTGSVDKESPTRPTTKEKDVESLKDTPYANHKKNVHSVR